MTMKKIGELMIPYNYTFIIYYDEDAEEKFRLYKRYGDHGKRRRILLKKAKSLCEVTEYINEIMHGRES